jgi:hypothetical protein
VGTFLFQKQLSNVTKTWFITFGIVLGYFILLLAFSLTSKTTTLPLNQDKCFDEWCASVIGINKKSFDTTTTYFVTIQISNHGRGRAQKPDSPAVYVVDDQEIKYVESEKAKSEYEKQHGQQRLITSRIDAQSNYQTTMVFVLPKGRKGNVVITEGGFPTPLIIGDEGSILHKKSVTPLD